MEEAKKNTAVTVDDILQILGPFGKFNVFNFILILFPVYLSGLYSSVYNFEVMDLEYRCSIPECDDPLILNYSIPLTQHGSRHKCRRYATFSNASTKTCSPADFDTSTEIPCESYVYLEDHSIVKEFDLACQDWKRSLVGTIHHAGLFISIPLTGFLSDKFGRRIAVIFSGITLGVFGVIRALSVNYNMFLVFEFLESAFGGGIYTACFVLALEFVGPKGRVFVSLLFNTMFILGGVSVTLLSWGLQNWRYLLLISYTPALVTLFYFCILSESFRWLFSKGRYNEGLNVLSRSENMNKIVIPKEYYVEIEKQATEQRTARKKENAESDQSSFKQLLLSSMIWKRLFACSFLWIASTLVYYGLSINAIDLSGNSYLNYIIILVIEAPANVCKLIFLDRFGRKKVISISYFFTAVILMCYGFIPGGNSILLYLGGKFFITLAYNSLYVYAAEVFPTSYRTTLLAFCSTVGRVGSTIAPLTPLLARYNTYVPTTLFGVMACISGFFVLTLPETRNRQLPDTLKDAQAQDMGERDEDIKENNTETSKTKL